MLTDLLTFARKNAELQLTDLATIMQFTEGDNNRGGRTRSYVKFAELPCRVTRPSIQIGESNLAMSPHTEERFDIAFSANTIEANNWQVKKDWQIIVRGVAYQVLDGSLEQTDAILYHVAVERLRNA